MDKTMTKDMTVRGYSGTMDVKAKLVDACPSGTENDLYLSFITRGCVEEEAKLNIYGTNVTKQLRKLGNFLLECADDIQGINDALREGK